jgi:polar amino acid transport system substrate-binding protein
MSSRLLRFFLLALITLSFVSSPVFAADLNNQLRDSSVISKILDDGKIKVGFSTFVPWAMKDKTGKFIGFEVDVMSKLAKDLGVKLEFVPTNWSGIIPALLAKKFDVIIGGMGITTARNLRVNFTIPYDTSGLAIVANKAKASGMTSLEDYNKEDVILVARMGSTPASAAKKFFPKARVRLFDKEAQCIQELLSGRVHAFISSAPLPAQTALKHPDKLFIPVAGTFTSEPIGFALRKGDSDTLNVLNNWILLQTSNGWLKERKHYWFETLDWESSLK